MGWFSRTFGSTNLNGDTIVIDIPATSYYKALAIHNAVSLIANAIGECEVITYENGVRVEKEDYYKLNVSPNPNQTASQFWHKVVEKSLAYDGNCLVIETNQGLYVADGYQIKEQRDILGHKYNCVQVGDITLRKTFNHDEVFYFELDHIDVKTLLDGAFKDYGELIDIASKAFKRSNANRYKFKIHANKAGDDQFMKLYTEKLSKQIKDYVSNDSGVYPEFEGYELVAENPTTKANQSDFVSIRKDMFEMVAMAYKIPSALLKGESRAIGEVMREFMTFAVKPVAMMIEQTLNKNIGYDLWNQDTYIVVDTSGVYHRDTFEIASSMNTLIASGAYSIDEVRVKNGDEPLKTEWSQKHFITKNYAEVEDYLKPPGGGENDEEVLPNS